MEQKRGICKSGPSNESQCVVANRKVTHHSPFEKAHRLSKTREEFQEETKSDPKDQVWENIPRPSQKILYKLSKTERQKKQKVDLKKEDKQMMLDTKSEQKWPLIACEKRDQGSFLFVLGRLTRSLMPMGMEPHGG